MRLEPATFRLHLIDSTTQERYKAKWIECIIVCYEKSYNYIVTGDRNCMTKYHILKFLLNIRTVTSIQSAIDSTILLVYNITFIKKI